MRVSSWVRQLNKGFSCLCWKDDFSLLVQWAFTFSIHVTESSDWFIIISVCVCTHDVWSADVRTALWNLSVMGSRNWTQVFRLCTANTLMCWAVSLSDRFLNINPPLHCFSESQTHSCCLKVFEMKIIHNFYCNYFSGLGIFVALIDKNSVFRKYIIKDYFSLKPWGKLS